MDLCKVTGGLESVLRPLLKKTLPKGSFERLTFGLRLGYWPDLNEPSSFNEIISFRKLNEGKLPRPELVDKLAVRDFVEQRIGSEYLTKVYQSYDKDNAIRLVDLPTAFALKCNTGSGLNLIVKDAREYSDAQLNDLAAGWVSQTYSECSHTYECIYDETPAKVFAEELLEPLETYREYKFWCFNGNPEFIQLQAGGAYHVFKPEGRKADFAVFNPIAQKDVNPPKCLNELIALAKALAKGFDFVRVDLVTSGEDRITFSELTFHPGGGRVRFYPRSKDFDLGAKMPKHSEGPAE